MKEFSDDIPIPFQKRWQSGDKRRINATDREELEERASGNIRFSASRDENEKLRQADETDSSRDFGEPVLSLSKLPQKAAPARFFVRNGISTLPNLATN
jgi:hypothetical protein